MDPEIVNIIVSSISLIEIIATAIFTFLIHYLPQTPKKCINKCCGNSEFDIE
jgi:hypothetical protein